MRMIQVDSSAVARMGYNVAHRILRLEYTNGRIYDYFNAPHAVYDELLVAESAGEFINLEIKPFYSYSEVE